MVVTADLARLESVAQQLIARLRDDDPKLVHAWLAYELPEPADWYRLCFVLACAIPDDRTWGQLTEWARPSPRLSRFGSPQGTSAPVHKSSTGLSTGVSAARSRPG